MRNSMGLGYKGWKKEEIILRRSEAFSVCLIINKMEFGGNLIFGVKEDNMNSRELVIKTLEFHNFSENVPIQMWVLPWAEIHHKGYVEQINASFDWDIVSAPSLLKKETISTKGNAFEIGEYIDEWGCIFENKHRGIIGEVKKPIVNGEEWEDYENVKIPYEMLDLDLEEINNFVKGTDKFVLSDLVRPFERLQFIRGTENLFVDLMFMPGNMKKFLEKMHEFHCAYLELWGQTNVDGLFFMDDWGAQRSLLINPKIWVEVFKPLYKDYIDIAKKYNKKIFMHSDGYILDIIPHLIELGLDAINSQIFCIGIDKLSEFKGKITFWGEMDRQALLPNGSEEEILEAVRVVKEKLWYKGGIIGQCEFDPGAKPENVYKVFEGWKANDGLEVLV